MAKKDAKYPENPSRQCMQRRLGPSYDQSREFWVRPDTGTLQLGSSRGTSEEAHVREQ